MQSRVLPLVRAVPLLLLCLAFALPALAAEVPVELLVISGGEPVIGAQVMIYTSADATEVITDEHGIARFSILEREFRAQVGDYISEIIQATGDGLTVLDIAP